MDRYQVYLNRQSVDIIDAFASETDISRSEIIRDVVDRLADNLSRALVQKKGITQPGVFDDLIGILSVVGNKKTNIAENIDEIYLKD